MSNINPNCDGCHCVHENGEVRKLPLESGGNLILCNQCYLEEINWRKDENRYLSMTDQDDFFSTPSWEELEIYEGC